ncbi:MAG: TusE/DsrC/DsvC family sulfur relay protein [Nitriliruptoraceae bacterium]
MPVVTIHEREVHLDEEGFLTDPSEWDEQLAHELAANIGLELTPRHLEVIAFARADAAENGETPTLRRMTAVGEFPTKELFQLFPKKPAKKLSYVAGLQKPVGCV